jgi:hypothetical protein
MAQLTRAQRAFVLMLFVFLQVSACAAADLDEVQPRNGHAFYGTFKYADKDGVSFLTDAGVILNIPWNKVRTLELHERVLVRSPKLPGPMPLDLHSPHIMAGNEQIQFTDGSTSQPLRAQDIVSMAPVGPEAAAAPPASWTASAAPTFSLTQGWQVIQTFGAQILVKRIQHPGELDWKHQETSLTLDATNTLIEQVGSPSIRIHEYDGNVSHSVFLGGGWYAVVLANGYHNSFQNIYLQQFYGGGIGKSTSWKRDTFEFAAEPVYVGQHFYGAPSDGFPGIRLSEQNVILLKKTDAGYVEWSESVAYIPAITLSRAWQVRGATTLSVPINKKLTFKTSYFDDYMENAPVRKNYSATTVGLTISVISPKK